LILRERDFMSEPGRSWQRWLQVDVVLTITALAGGLGGALLAGRYLSASAAAAKADVERRYEPEEVVVASADLKRGESLGSGNLALRRIPREFLPADAVPALRAEQVLATRAAIDIARGTPITTAAISEAEVLLPLSARLAVGERAVTVSVDDLNSQAGGVRRGDRVDLYFGPRESADSLLVPLLQEVEVLAAGEYALDVDGGEPRQYSTVTLRVTAEQAPMVLLAQQAGDLSILLRNGSDREPVRSTVRNSRELLQPAQPTAAEPGMEVLTGGAGQLTPVRTWLRVGSVMARGAT
jgi:pilus assembly protein CpaB